MIQKQPLENPPLNRVRILKFIHKSNLIFGAQCLDQPRGIVAVQGGCHLAEHIIVADPAVLSLDPGGVCLKLLDGIDRQIISQLNKNLSQGLQPLRNGFKIRTNLNIYENSDYRISQI